MRYHEFKAMNTTILAAGEGEPERLEEGFQAVEAFVREQEARFTRFTDTSELADLNQSAGCWFPASPEMYEVVSLAAEYHAETDGLFNPGILAALEQAGYDRSMDLIRSSGGKTSVVDQWPRPRPDFRQIAFDDQRRAIRLPSGLRIDLGGIAKGWIAEQAAIKLKAYASACVVDAGGDLYAVGLLKGAEGWTVAVEDPFDASRDCAVLCTLPGGVATSTITKRRWLQGGQEQHHLIDPRTGRPANTFWASVTVVAAHTALAEVLAKALLIGGPGVADVLVNRYKGVAFIAVDGKGKLWGSENSKKVLYGNAEKAY